MRNEIRRIQQQAGITAVYVTRDQSEAMALSDDIIMKKSVVDQVGDEAFVKFGPGDVHVLYRPNRPRSFMGPACAPTVRVGLIAAG